VEHPQWANLPQPASHKGQLSSSSAPQPPVNLGEQAKCTGERANSSQSKYLPELGAAWALLGAHSHLTKFNLFRSEDQGSINLFESVLTFGARCAK
jgi:hypothetical protein